MWWVMFDVLKSNIDELKKRIQFNLDIISKNEKHIQKLLNEPVSKERAKKLNERFEFNNRLLDENKDAIKLQKNIIDFMEKHKVEMDNTFYFITDSNEEDMLKESLTRDDYFELTANKTLDFDQEHPYFFDQDFINELIAYFSEIEDYEMCAYVIKSQKQIESNPL